MKSYSESYKESGVDITAGYRAVELMRKHVDRTKAGLAADQIGGFGGCFDISGEKGSVLVSGTDGVGTKLKLAFMMDRHDTVGIDCVAMCVNDIICLGAKPLIFLDYIACGKNIPERIADIVSGVADGCVEAGAALVGGETAEMPGFYPEDEYDLAGFSVGIVEKERMLRKESVREGDAVIALPSSGVHSNGFSLVRRVFSIDSDPSVLGRRFDDLGTTLGEALLEPTRIYVKDMLELISSCRVHSCAHITGGGFYENMPRALPEGLGISIRSNGAPWQMVTLATALEKQGFEARPDGLFVMKDKEKGSVLFTLSTNESAASETATRLTLLMDVPCVAQELDGFAQMIQCGKALCIRLDGALIDDGNQLLTDKFIEEIAGQVNDFYRDMEKGGIAAGSYRAMRLFG